MPDTSNTSLPEIVAQAKNKLSKASIMGLSIFGGIMLLIAIFTITSFYQNVPNVKQRVHDANLPWETNDIEVEEAKATWKSSQGNARLELRVAYYPQLELNLAMAKGSGLMYVDFVNSQDQRVGSTIVLTYTVEGFARNSASENIQIKGKSAIVNVEGGFASKDEYTIHRNSETEALWTAHVSYKPDTSEEVIKLGSVDVTVH